ncbi:MAG: ABC transporter permease, partial [Bacteroidales bacterium]|nr:ABC transporter permease [Bacteroidales bacterium]
MNFHRTGIVLTREYLNKVKKKSFLITTFLVPVLFAALCILPSILMMNAKEKKQNVAVVDYSGIVMPFFE